jgi:hypothetical protein
VLGGGAAAGEVKELAAFAAPGSSKSCRQMQTVEIAVVIGGAQMLLGEPRNAAN